MGKMFF